MRLWQARGNVGVRTRATIGYFIPIPDIHREFTISIHFFVPSTHDALSYSELLKSDRRLLEAPKLWH